MTLKPVSEMAEKIWDTIFDCRKTPSAKELNNILTQDRLSSYKAIEGILEGWTEGTCKRCRGSVPQFNCKGHAYVDLKQELKTLFNINE